MLINSTARGAALLALLCWSACRGAPVTPPVPRQVVDLTFFPTDVLVQDPAVRALVDRVAAQEAVAPPMAPHTGPSPDYDAFADLAGRLGPALSTLAKHRSAVVRTYTIRYLLAEYPEQAPAVAPLLVDRAPVQMRRRGKRTKLKDVGTVALELACHHGDRPPVQDLLADAARRPELGSFRAEALSCLSRRDPQRARSIALDIYKERNDAYLPAVLRALGAAHSVADLLTLQAHATHRDPQVREAVAWALGQTPGADVTPVRDLLRDGDLHVRAEAARSLARSGTPEAIRWLEDYVLTDPEGSDVIEYLSGQQNEAVLHLLRRVVRDSGDESARMHALRRLAAAHDEKSRPAFRHALQSDYLPERTMAAEGLVTLKDQSAVPALIKMMHDDPQKSGRMAAAMALSRLATPEAVAALTTAAQQPGPASSEIRALVQRAQQTVK